MKKLFSDQNFLDLDLRPDALVVAQVRLLDHDLTRLHDPDRHAVGVGVRVGVGVGGGLRDSLFFLRRGLIFLLPIGVVVDVSVDVDVGDG